MLQTFISAVVDLLLPPRKTERLVRTLTLEKLHSLQTEVGLPYHDPRVTAVVWELKYHRSTRALALCGALLAEDLLAVASEELGKPLLVPVPMHTERRRKRGHNQTELLCKAALLHLFGAFEYAPLVLVRILNPAPQQGLERGKRLKNVEGSMAANPEAVRGRVCVVVDDVSTTGATFTECKRALKTAGAARVHCIALTQS